MARVAKPKAEDQAPASDQVSRGALSDPAELPDAKICLELLELMALIRRFEEEAGSQYQRAKAGGFLHLAIGEEATIVGTTSVMRAEDYLIGTYRTHGHAIARGTDPRRVMAEIFGRVDGTSRGRGGSMHIFDAERRFVGVYGILIDSFSSVVTLPFLSVVVLASSDPQAPMPTPAPIPSAAAASTAASRFLISITSLSYRLSIEPIISLRRRLHSLYGLTSSLRIARRSRFGGLNSVG